MTDLLLSPATRMESAPGRPDILDARPGAVIRLLAWCPDRTGIVNGVTRFLFGQGANIIRSDQHASGDGDAMLFLRLEFCLPEGTSPGDFVQDFTTCVAHRFDMTWRMVEAEKVKRCAVLVSRADHCLVDLLWRWKRQRLGADISLVASNHPDLRELTESFGIPFHHVPIDKDNPDEGHGRLARLLRGHCDFVVLARYMQILPTAFLNEVAAPLINIHHSFLPAFAGGSPYDQAKRRGVKLIGATAHYVTAELDAGPIIEQDVVRVSHRDDVSSLRCMGADVERAVLARAVRWHSEDRLLQHGNSVVVF